MVGERRVDLLADAAHEVVALLDVLYDHRHVLLLLRLPQQVEDDHVRHAVRLHLVQLHDLVDLQRALPAAVPLVPRQQAVVGPHGRLHSLAANRLEQLLGALHVAGANVAVQQHLVVHERRGVALRQHHVPYGQRDGVRVLPHAAHANRVHVVVAVDAHLRLLHLQNHLVCDVAATVLVEQVEHLGITTHHEEKQALHVVLPRVMVQHAADQGNEVLNRQTHIVVAQLLECVKCPLHILLRRVLVTPNTLNKATLKKTTLAYSFRSLSLFKSSSCRVLFLFVTAVAEDLGADEFSTVLLK